MEDVLNVVGNGITATSLASAVPQVGSALLAIILFSIGFTMFRRFLRGAKKLKARI